MNEPGPERDFAVLELGSDASLAQVKSAYLRLKKLYSGESPLLSPIARDFPEEKRLRILIEVEEAYHNLLKHFHVEHIEEHLAAGRVFPLSPLAPLRESGSEGGAAGGELTFSGPVMKKIRQDLGIPLQTISRDTKLRGEQLEAIESESFEKLPDEAYLRAQLKAYAGHLLLNPVKVISDYLKRFLEWKKTHPPPGR